MGETDSVPVIIIGQKQDQVEAVNSILRNAGHVVHCAWISDLNEFADALNQINPEIVLLFDQSDKRLAKVIKVRNRFAPEVPVLVVRNKIDEAVIAKAMQAGAKDALSLKHPSRFESVIGREFRAFRVERALNDTLHSATEYKKQLKAFMMGSADAITHVQEGIVLDVNPAWLELFGYPDDETFNNQPVMDFFDKESRAAIKGALVATEQGKWTGPSLQATAVCSDGSRLSLALELDIGTYDSEPCVRIKVPRDRPEDKDPDVRITHALHNDPSTHIYHRNYLLEKLAERLKKKPQGGVRALAYIRPDNFGEICREVGLLGSEELLVGLASIVRQLAQPNDVYGRLGGNSFLVLLERGTIRDVEAWADFFVKKTAGQLFEISDQSISATCSLGLTLLDPMPKALALLLEEAAAANGQAREKGGNRVYSQDFTVSDSGIREIDSSWVERIKSALVDNRFRLVQQPIASLQGDVSGYYDTLVRMLDNDGNEVMPGEFIPAAERNELMKNIDRWVIGASTVYCRAKKPNMLFVRLSRHSLLDGTLLAWIKKQLKSSGVDQSRLCIQVTEADISRHLKQACALAKMLRKLGMKFAIEHFGLARDSKQLLDHVEVDFLKIDGSLMQGLAANETLQTMVRGLTESAARHDVRTIAERVEDANTMAVLWQLGVEFMQGYYVQEPEVVLEDTSDTGVYTGTHTGLHSAPDSSR